MSTIKTSLDGAPDALHALTADLVWQAGQEVKSRGFRVANELRTASNHVLSGQRHGRRYIVPGTGRWHYKRGKRVVIGREEDNYGRKGRKKYGRLAGKAWITYRHYTASAPGEPPAVRTGMFRLGWKQRSYAEDLTGGQCNVHGIIENDQKANGHLLGEMLENGTSRMAPRPYQQRVIDRAMPKVLGIYNEPYFKD